MSKKKKAAKKKNKRKVVILPPTDRTNTPIDIGDVLEWEDGTRMQVSSMTYYGEDFRSIGCWTAEDENGEFTDNLSGSLIVWRKR